MNIFEKIIYFLMPTMEQPHSYGWFHIMWVVIIVLVTTLICIFFKNASDKTYRKIVLITSIIIILFEIYKNIVLSFNLNNDGTVTWSYPWYAFPFQFCSSALYVFPLIALLKDSKVRDSIIAFTCLYCLFAGLSVFVYPETVFTELVGINIQTMVHHGSQIVIGIYSLVYFRTKINLKLFIKAIPTFLVFIIVATILNETLVYIPNAYINLFYISSHFPSTLPILSSIYNVVPYIVFYFIYIIGFTLVSLIVNLAAIGIKKLCIKN